MNSVNLPSCLINDLKSFAASMSYAHALVILERGQDDQIIFTSERDVRMIDELMEVWVLNASLKNPYRDEDEPFYNPEHEDNWDDVNAGDLQKYALSMTPVYNAYNMGVSARPAED